MKTVLDTEGRNITSWILKAAEKYEVKDPVPFLALLKAESGFNPRAERWATLEHNYTKEAQEAIARGDRHRVFQLIQMCWADISFCYGQQIVAYHYLGDYSDTYENVMYVRENTFADLEGNIFDAMKRYSSYLHRRQYDGTPGTPLSAMIAYNAGSDRRGDVRWMESWAGNVASYERELENVEIYRGEDEEEEVNKDRIEKYAAEVWKYKDFLETLGAEEAVEAIVKFITVVKEEAGMQPKVSGLE